MGGEPGAPRQAHTPRQNEAAAGYGSEDRPQSQHTSAGSRVQRGVPCHLEVSPFRPSTPPVLNKLHLHLCWEGS